jgi:hypothetical protein
MCSGSAIGFDIEAMRRITSAFGEPLAEVRFERLTRALGSPAELSYGRVGEIADEKLDQSEPHHPAINQIAKISRCGLVQFGCKNDRRMLETERLFYIVNLDLSVCLRGARRPAPHDLSPASVT